MGLDFVPASQEKQAAAAPAIEFIIARGQEESVFHADGSVATRKAEGKLDPNCKNSVKSPDGSEQRFDNVGLCKLKGQVKWGKTDSDGVMEINVGNNGSLQMRLDKNWQLLSVKSENAQFLKSNQIEAKMPELPKQAPAVPAEERIKDHKGWKPIYPSEKSAKSDRLPQAEVAPRQQLRNQARPAETGARKQEVGTVKRPVGMPLNILPRQFN